MRHQPHTIIVHYCGCDEEDCIPTQISALTTDPEGVLNLFKRIEKELSDYKNHFCTNCGIRIELIPHTGAS